jgi:hypothetical protein
LSVAVVLLLFGFAHQTYFEITQLPLVVAPVTSNLSRLVVMAPLHWGQKARPKEIRLWQQRSPKELQSRMPKVLLAEQIPLIRRLSASSNSLQFPTTFEASLPTRA